MELSTKLFRRCSYRWGVVCFLMCFLFFNASVSIVAAGPEGAQVVNGDVTIQQSGNNTAITASNKAIINYSSFDIAQPETVQFIQPGSNASVLNRILSANPTNINGTLLANGRVFFVNPAGVYIGNGARINVNQLVASGLNISNADFINGRYNFVGGNGSVINSGDISAQKVYLIGKQVTNSGNISCPAGYVVMAAGDRVFLGELGSDIVLDVEGTSLSESANTAAPEVGVLNEGKIDAAGGIIALAAAGDIYSQAISNVGSLSTSADTGDAGQIKLAAAGGEVINTGTIEASGDEGGQVAMEGARVGQFGTIHADGTTGDGGNVDLTASDVVALSSDSVTTANAGTNGNGGGVIVYSPDTALFWSGANIEAKGGSESGDGGFVEVSGKKHVEVYGIVNTTALKGNVGTFLIDPYDIEIGDWEPDVTQNGSWTGADPQVWTSEVSANSQLDVDDLLLSLESTDVEVQTGGAAGGDITVTDPINYTDIDVITYNDLTLRAHNDIIVNAEITAGTHDLTLIADSDSLGGGNVSVNAAINMTSGNFTSSGVNFASNSNGTVTTTGGNVDLSGHSGAVNIDAAINAGGSVNIAGSSINISSDITAGSGLTFNSSVIAGGAGDQTFDAGSGTLTAEGNITNNSGSLLTLGGGAGLSLKGNITGGSITLDDNASADGAGLQTFDAGSGTFTAESSISKAAGNLVLGGDTDINLNGAVTVSAGSLTVGDSAHIADDVTAVGVTFSDTVTADGAGLQTFDAGSGTLTAEGNITNNNGSLLTLGGGAGLSLKGNVTGGSITLDDNATADGSAAQTFDAGSGTLTAEGNITNNSGSLLTLGGDAGLSLKGNVTGGSITLEDNATANGAGLQTFDAGTGTLTADATINKSTGNLVLGGNTDIDLNGAVTVSAGSLTVGDSAHIADDVTAVGVTFSGTVTADGAGLQTFDAGAGIMTAPSTINKATGNLVLGGDTDINLNGAVTVSAGSLTVGDSAHIADDVTAVGVTFSGTVIADGAGLQTFDAGTGTLTTGGVINKPTGNLVLGGDTDIDLSDTVTVSTGSLTVSNSAHIADNMTAVGVTFSGTVTADGAGLQTFDAGTGTLTADATINKSTGNLVLGGATDIDLNGAVTVSTGSLTVGDSAHIANNVTAVGVTFSGTVTADGAGLQTFDAGAGTLTADAAINKPTGNLILGGDTDINLNGSVTASNGSLTVGDSAHIADDVTAVGVTFSDIVTADGAGLQTFDAGAGTLTANATINKPTGNLVLGGDTDIDLNGAVTVSAGSLTVDDSSHIAENVTTAGNQTYNDNVIVANGKTLSAGNNLTAGASLTGGGELTLIATGGSIGGSGTIQAKAGVGTDGVLTLRQGESLDMAALTIGNQSTTDLTVQSYNGGVTIDNTKPDNAADKWKSITATAENNIKLQGTSDIKIGGNLTSNSGGVSIISTDGTVLKAGKSILDDVTITGSSTSVPGVDLDPSKPGSGEAAIVIRTKNDLILGSNAQLIANGQYDPQQNDDRYAVGFDNSTSGGGDPIDIAIYLRSNRTDATGPIGNVVVNSMVKMDNKGTMVVDAGEKVIFGGKFNESEFNQTQRLEVVSRRSDDLNQVIRYSRLPFADNPEAIRNWFNETSTGYFAGAYVLRGVKTLLAEVLALTNPVPLVPPRPLEPEFRGEVEGPDTKALIELLSELGIGVQPYMTEAYADSLSTDLRLYKAAEKLQKLMPVLEDVNGIHIAGLREAVADYFPTLDVLSDERMDSFAQVLTSHKGDGTDFDLAGQSIFALTEYVNILCTDIGWPVETSVEFVMGRYVPRLTENDEIRIAVIQMRLQKEL